MAQTQVILLERIEKLGKMGDVVAVKPGYARNYLLPQKKALRASKENVAYFEAQRKHLEGESDKLKKEAEKTAKKLDGLKVALIRQASEGGQLFGSVSARDIAAEITTATKETVDRSMVRLNQSYKILGLFPVEVTLHPEVVATVTINIARSAEEAETQARTGKAMIAEAAAAPVAATDDTEIADEQLAEILDDEALQAEKEKKESAKEKKKAEAAEAGEESESKGKKKPAKKDAETAEDTDADAE